MLNLTYLREAARQDTNSSGTATPTRVPPNANMKLNLISFCMPAEQNPKQAQFSRVLFKDSSNSVIQNPTFTRSHSWRIREQTHKRQPLVYFRELQNKETYVSWSLH